jgi:hypothetical protein
LGPALARARCWAGAPPRFDALLDGWWARQPGGSTSSTRYRWDTSHKHCPLPAWAGRVETWRAWPARFRERFDEGAPVASRILVTSGSGADLRAMRERLGRSLAPLKAAPAPGPDGMLVPV